tara:strand:+ start:6938 stop:7450 length:513 start_codon:yes stop_codon:yes gene_type:complete
MNKRRIYDEKRYVHFITFSCYGNRQHLNRDEAKRRLLGSLNEALKRHNAICVGFVIMPDHVHTLIWFHEVGKLSDFMRDWKRSSSRSIKLFLESQDEYKNSFPAEDPIWQKRYYSFEIESEFKLEAKLTYIHMNPVKKGIVSRISDWPWSSARHYELSKSVGVPIGWPER